VKRFLATIIVAPFLLFACGGGDGGDPQATLADAVRGLGEAEGLTIGLTLQSTPESLQALAASDGDDISAEDAEKILDSSVTVSARSTSDPKEAASEIRINVAGNEDAAELRVLGTTLYARADVRELLEEFGGGAASVDAFVAQAKQAGLTFIQSAVEGKWISVSGLDELQKQFGGAAPAAGPPPQKIFDDLAKEIEETAEVREGDEEGPGTHYIVTVNARKIVSALIDLAQRAGQALPPGALPPESEIPDRDISFDAWVEDDFVRQLELDLRQFAEFEEGADIPENVEKFALRLGIDEFDGDVTAPADAVDVPVQQLMQLLFSGLAGAPGS
jgi:hypothetical protein